MSASTKRCRNSRNACSSSAPEAENVVAARHIKPGLIMSCPLQSTAFYPSVNAHPQRAWLLINQRVALVKPDASKFANAVIDKCTNFGRQHLRVRINHLDRQRLGFEKLTKE